jgi:DNA repair ATPase RecN
MTEAERKRVEEIRAWVGKHRFKEEEYETLLLFIDQQSSTISEQAKEIERHAEDVAALIRQIQTRDEEVERLNSRISALMSAIARNYSEHIDRLADWNQENERLRTELSRLKAGIERILDADRVCKPQFRNGVELETYAKALNHLAELLAGGGDND